MATKTKQEKAIALNARINHFIDLGLSAEEVIKFLGDKNTKIGFIRRLIEKRINLGIKDEK